MKKCLQQAAKRLWNDRALWFSAGILVLLFYNLYLGSHYSPDTWSMEQYLRDIDAANHTLGEKWALLYEPFAMQGRFVRGFLMFLLGIANKSSLVISNFANAVALGLFVCTFVCGYQTLRALLPCQNGAGVKGEAAFAKNETSEKTLCRSAQKGFSGVCFLGTAVLLCNPFFCDWLQFAECSMVFVFGLLLAVLAARVLVSKLPVAARVILCAVLLVLAAGIYQITLQFFVLFVMLAVVLCAVCGVNARNGKQMLRDALVLALQAFGGYLCAVATQYLFTRVLYQNWRMASDFAATVPLIQTAQGQLWNMAYLGTQTYLFAACTGLLALLAVAALILAVRKKKLSPAALGVVAVAFAAYYCSVFVMMLVSDGSIPHRTVVGFFGIPLFCGVCLCAALHCGEFPNIIKRIFGAATMGALCVVLCFNWYQTQRFGTYLLRSNAQDAMIARSMQQCITEYEQKSSETVTQVAFYRMPGRVVHYPDVYQSHDLNLRAWTMEWNQLPLLNLVNGTSYVQTDADNAVYEAQFSGHEWTEFSSGQVYCEGSTAHIVIY